MKKTKKPQYFDWEITDAFVTSDAWDNWDYELTQELEAMRDIEVFKAIGAHTFAHIYLNNAEDIMFKNSRFGSGMLSLIHELRQSIKGREAWRIFMQTLRLVTLTNRAGDIPKTARTGKKYKQEQSERGGKRWKEKADALEIRNKKIFKHFKETHLTPRSFAIRHAADHGLKPRHVQDIIKIMAART